MLNLLKDIRFANFSLIVPSVSIGNVGQLTVDLLISSLQMEKVGTLWDPAIIPALGADPYKNSTEPSISCELYASISNNLAVLQIRSGLHKRYSKKFLEKLSKLIKDKQFSNVFVLTSCFAYEQHAIKSSPFRYAANEPMLKEYNAKLSTLKWEPFENTSQDGPQYENLKLNGDGFGVRLFQELDAENIKCLLVMKYCSEGDNIPDAIAVLNYLDEYFKIFKDIHQQIQYPPSWNLLFGGPPPIGIY